MRKRPREYVASARSALVDDLGATFGGPAPSRDRREDDLSNWAKKRCSTRRFLRKRGSAAAVLTPSSAAWRDRQACHYGGVRRFREPLASAHDAQLTTFPSPGDRPL